MGRGTNPFAPENLFGVFRTAFQSVFAECRHFSDAQSSIALCLSLLFASRSLSCIESGRILTCFVLLQKSIKWVMINAGIRRLKAALH